MSLRGCGWMAAALALQLLSCAPQSARTVRPTMPLLQLRERDASEKTNPQIPEVKSTELRWDWGESRPGSRLDWGSAGAPDQFWDYCKRRQTCWKVHFAHLPPLLLVQQWVSILLADQLRCLFIGGGRENEAGSPFSRLNVPTLWC